MKLLKELPIEFRQLENIPKEIYYKGDISLLKRKKVAIVGSRRILNYTRALVYELSSKLSRSDVVVVSGAALGVDIVAHKAALPNTIAIMPTSLDNIYPKSNKEIIEQIYKDALALSEYAKESKMTKYSFIERNRLVVALSDAVVIAQADLNSGSMHSARWALEQNKELFVLPHRAGESDGTNSLLALNRATLIDNIDSFVKQFSTDIDSVDDELLKWCETNPDYEEAYRRFGDRLLEYELDGKIVIENARVIVL